AGDQRVVKQWPKLLNQCGISPKEHAIGEQRADKLPHRINPQRRASEAGMPVAPGAETCARRRWDIVDRPTQPTIFELCARGVVCQCRTDQFASTVKVQLTEAGNVRRRSEQARVPGDAVQSGTI